MNIGYRDKLSTAPPFGNIRAFLMIGMLASGVIAQEFILVTPKGDVIVNVTHNDFTMGSAFHMTGTITNKTPWDLEHLRMRVAFYDASGRVLQGLCGPSFCDTVGVHILAGETKEWDEIPGVPFQSSLMDYPPHAVRSYKIAFEDAEYHVKWHFSLLKPKPSDDLSYEDDSVDTTFSLAPTGIGIRLHNRTSDPVIINWNNVSWVDDSGEAHKVVHSGVLLIDKDKPQTPTVIPPMARITDTMFPSDHFKVASFGSHIEPLWPDLVNMSGDQSALKKVEGTMFSVFVPLDIGGTTKNYSFVFKITSVEY